MLALATPFRIFFVLAGLLAAIWIPAWVYIATENAELQSNLGSMGWHAHEMVFGYVGAVLAGFLLTAARNWTRRPTLSGAPLGGLVLLWAIGRIAVLNTARLPSATPAIIDGLFFAILAAALAVPIIGAASRRNLAFPVLILVIGVCDVGVHLHVQGVLLPWSARSLDVALDAITLIMIIFAGRIIPLFTRNGTGARARERDHRDTLGVLSVAALLVARAVAPEHPVVFILAVLAGLANIIRLIGWGGRRTLGKPILWVLHLGWFLLAAAITLSGVNKLIVLAPPGTFIHLLTIGGLGTLTIGMMARVSLGHTGRELEVSRVVAVGFILVVIAAGCRVSAQLVGPLHYATFLWISSAAWALAFTAFLVFHAPVLLSPRADGKPG